MNGACPLVREAGDKVFGLDEMFHRHLGVLSRIEAEGCPPILRNEPEQGFREFDLGSRLIPIESKVVRVMKAAMPLSKSSLHQLWRDRK